MAGGGLRTTAALAATRLVAGASRVARIGSGSTVGGRAGLLIEPALLERLSRDRRVALVSGTNGKTTTTRLLAEAVRTAGSVASSSAGANMPAGIVSALAEAGDARFAILEVDEGYLPAVARASDPEVVVLLNLSRDQLDRVSEVRMLARRWREALADSAAVVIANADDPLVVWAAQSAPRHRFVAAGGLWRADAYHCPLCGAHLDLVGPDGDSGDERPWSCRCGFSRPLPAASLTDDALEFADGSSLPFALALPGRFNRANAALATLAAVELGVRPEDALGAMAKVTEVGGRFSRASWHGREVRLLLAKNPAGWTELLELLRHGEGPVVLGINARIADGHDPSWLWDVPFELLAGRPVVATGDRRLDLAVRLRHAGVSHRVADDPLSAISVAPGPVDYIGNYTAFQDLRRDLARRSDPAPEPAASSPWSAMPTPMPVPGPSESTAPNAPSGDPGVADLAPAGLAWHAPSGAGPEGEPVQKRRGPRSASALRVVVVHPDLLGTYGDGGNGTVLADRAAWRGISVELLLAASDAALPVSGDLYVLGGGEDGPQSRSAEVLRAGPLRRAVDDGAVVLAVCAGYQIIGTAFPGSDGRPLAGVGLLDVETVRVAGPRAVGELLVEGPPPTDLALAAKDLLGAELLLSGFENHAGHTVLGAGVAPLGRVLGGIGNGDGSDGARSGRVLGTYLHGPVLARNPLLADRLLQLATGAELAPLDDAEEEDLRRARLAAVSGQNRRARSVWRIPAISRR
ncbi:MAG: ligase [Acidimicrobiaceae bacterium]|nr:ligase [Acidimicrobiaceae bacterium]